MSMDAPTKWWRATKYSIEEVDVIKSSKKFVVLPTQRRGAIDTSWAHYRPTREEAKDAVIADCLDQVRSQEAALDFYRKELERVKNL